MAVMASANTEDFGENIGDDKSSTVDMGMTSELEFSTILANICVLLCSYLIYLLGLTILHCVQDEGSTVCEFSTNFTKPSFEVFIPRGYA
jgi:hypothetical protein